MRDFRHGFAALARDPGFSVVAIGVLALGIGANVAMFSLVDAVLLKPLPFAEPDRIVRVWPAPRLGVTNSTSTLDFLDWRRMATSFDAMAAEQFVSVALTGEGEPKRFPGSEATVEYFQVFGIKPRLGRLFLPGEDQPGARSKDVLARVLQNGLQTVGLGIVFGLGGALAATRVIESMLYDVSPLDPLSFGLACAAMATRGLLAGLLPARRAASVQPMAALREE